MDMSNMIDKVKDLFGASNINQELVEKYKNEPVLIKTYYAGMSNEIIDGIINPIRIDNRHLVSPMDNQENLPACAGFSACTLIESIYWKKTGKLIQLEAAQVYAKAKQIDGQMNVEGTYLESSLEAARQLIDIDCFRNSKTRLFYNNHTQNVIETVKFLIHKYDFVQVGFMIDDAWYRCNNTNYKLSRGSRTLGGHAVLLCGYDTEGVYVCNQWGAGWGAKGFAVMPWDIFLEELMYGAYLDI